MSDPLEGLREAFRKAGGSNPWGAAPPGTDTETATISKLRAELQGEVPLGTTYAEMPLLLAAMAEEIRHLHQMFRDLT